LEEGDLNSNIKEKKEMEDVQVLEFCIIQMVYATKVNSKIT
jgi:hypothetical protein